MDEATDVVQATTKEAQNFSSIGIGLESEGSKNDVRKSAHTPTTQRSPELLSLQKEPVSSESMPEPNPSKKEGQKTNDSHLPRQNTKQPAEPVTNPKKTKQRLRKGKWTVSVYRE